MISKNLKLILLALFTLTVTAVTTMALNKGKSMSAMSCETFDSEKFDAILAEQLAAPVAPASAGKADTTTFLLKNFEPITHVDDDVFIVRASEAGGTIYHGKLQKEIVIPVPSNLLSKKGWDGFSFFLANKRTRHVCYAEHEASFWQAGKKIVIELLRERQIDKDGYPVAFKVYEG